MKELENAISPTGHVIVRVDRLMEENARREDGSVSSLKQDIRFDNHSKMVTTGIVVAGTMDGGNEVVSDIDYILPRSKTRPAGYRFSNSFNVDIRKGDRVWFHYLCAENKALVQPIASGGFYITMNAYDVFCLQRGDDPMSELIWNFSFCAGDQIVEDERKHEILDAHGNVLKAKVKPSQGLEIVVGLFAKPMVNECIMWGIGPSQFDDVSKEVKAGDHVYLSKDSEFVNYIKDHACWVFKHGDILGHVKRNSAEVRPVGRYHLVKIAINDYKTETRRQVVKDDLTGHMATMISKRPIVVIPSSGVVVASGGLCTHAALGETVIFTVRWMRMLDRYYWLIHDDEIQGKL